MPKANTQFQKGVSGNPGGRAPLPEDVRKAKDLTAVEFTRIINSFFHIKTEQLDKIIASPDSTNLQKLVGGILSRAIKEQDQVRATFLLDRSIGKVKEQIEVSSRPFIIERLNGDQVLLGSEPVIDAEVKK